MQAPSDNQRIEALEEKIDKGFAEVRVQIASSERELRTQIIAARDDARSDFRTVIAVTLGMWVTTILSIVGVLLQHQA
jgi:hypothetical protein